MSRLMRVIPTVLRQIVRSPIRSGLTVAGIAVAMFLFVSVEAMREGVREATQVQAGDTTLVVYRENRFCPFSSRLPQFYNDRIERVDGVSAVVPMQIHVSNCRASLDVVTFRGVPRDDLARAVSGGVVKNGSIAEWQVRGDAAIVGEALAARRGIKAGDRFSAAGITVFVAGILETDHPQDRNIAWVHLPFLQEASRRGGSGGLVTQFNVSVAEPDQLEIVAAAIDELFVHDEYPTSTRPERAFVGRAARDIVELVDFAGMLAWGALAAVFALIANAIILAMQDRIRDHAVLQTLGFTGPLIGWMVILEAAFLGLLGGVFGAGSAFLVVRLGNFSLTMEGLNVEIAASWFAPTIGIIAALILGLLAGLVPAIRMARRDIATCFRSV
jgi:putative ABC transport system permease protein